MKKIQSGVIAAIAVVLLMGSWARAQVLQQVPADALMVVKVNNLKGFSDKLAKLSQDLGLAAMVPPMADPLAFIQQQLKVSQGVDTAGELAFVFLDPATLPPTAEDTPFAILVPITDAKAFLTNWPEAKTEADITEVRLGGSERGFVSMRGKYAAITPIREIAAMKVTAPLSTPTVTSKELSTKDAILYANINSLRNKALPLTQFGRMQLAQEFEGGMRGAPPQFARLAPVFKAVVNQIFTAVDTYLNDADAATVGITLVPEGINTTVTTEFKTGSYLANLFTTQKNTDASLLTGLPKGKYLMYGGSVDNPAALTKLVDDFAGPIIKELLAVGPEMAPVQDYIGTVKTAIGARTGGSVGILAPTGALGAESLVQVVGVSTGNAKVMADSTTKLVTSQTALMQSFGLPGMDAMKPIHTPNAKTIDGVNFDSLVTKVDMNAQNPMAAQQAQILGLIYGPQGQVMLYGVGGDKMLMGMGVSDAVLSSLIATAKANQTPLAENDNIKAVAAQLPKQRLGVVYIAVGDLVTTGFKYAGDLGFRLPVQVAPDLPPVGVAISTEGTAIKIDSHVPTLLIQSLTAATMQVQMQMQGGGMPPGGGL